MTYQIPTQEPLSITAGDTIQWTRNDLTASYPAASGWALTYTLANQSAVYSFGATGSVTGYAVNVPALTSKDWVAGTYNYQAYVTNGVERHKVGFGSIKILPNFAAATGSLDVRSHVKTVLDNIEAVIVGRATKDQESYTILGRSLKLTPMADLIMLRDKYKAEYQAELNAEKARNGLPGKNRIAVRF